MGKENFIIPLFCLLIFRGCNFDSEETNYTIAKMTVDTDSIIEIEVEKDIDDKDTVIKYLSSLKTFNPKEYPEDTFEVRIKSVEFSGLEIEVVNINPKDYRYIGNDFVAKSYLNVRKQKELINQIYYESIIGAPRIYVPKNQPSKEYFIAVKCGDYDGRLLMIGKNGKVKNFIGGTYFITKNKRYLFSIYNSDAYGLMVYDFKNDKMIFSEKDKVEAAYHVKWYIKDGKYYWLAEWGEESEGKLSFDMFDFNSRKLKRVLVNKEELNTLEEIKYDFDPC